MDKGKWMIMIVFVTFHVCKNECFKHPCDENTYHINFARACGGNGNSVCSTEQMSESISSKYAVDDDLQTCSSINPSQKDSWWKLDMIHQRNVEIIEFSYQKPLGNVDYLIYVTNSTDFKDINVSKSLCVMTNINSDEMNTTKIVLCDEMLVGRFVYFSFSENTVSLCNVEIMENMCSNCITGSYVESGFNKYADCQCARGSFRDKSRCQLCTKGKTTNASLVTSQSDCVICDTGYDAKDQSCQRCDVGFVKNKITHECDQCASHTFNNYAGEDRCFDCFSGGTQFFERCLKGNTDHVTCPRLCRSYPGYQLTGLNLGNLEKCPIGFFNNDYTRTMCQTCGEKTTTNSTGSINISECNICTFRYTRPGCLECVSGYSSFFSNGFCRIIPGVKVFLRVVVIVSGELNANTSMDTINAFSKVSKFNKTFVTNVQDVPQRRALIIGNSVVEAKKKIIFDVLTNDSDVENLKSRILNADMIALKSQNGMGKVIVQIESVEILIDTTDMVGYEDIILILTIVGSVFLGLSICCCVVGFCCCSSSSRTGISPFMSPYTLMMMSGKMKSQRRNPRNSTTYI